RSLDADDFPPIETLATAKTSLPTACWRVEAGLASRVTETINYLKGTLPTELDLYPGNVELLQSYSTDVIQMYKSFAISSPGNTADSELIAAKVERSLGSDSSKVASEDKELLMLVVNALNCLL
ncbi:hypothetical protein KFL_002060010, partial [Klebsormidium nitens]